MDQQGNNTKTHDEPLNGHYRVQPGPVHQQQEGRNQEQHLEFRSQLAAGRPIDHRPSNADCFLGRSGAGADGDQSQ